ncbi:MAG: DUF4287 domain-containing protein [Kiloniellales bacterium]|nr:DUF4287 domain-containing protein [Kiloniellales bacterium]
MANAKPDRDPVVFQVSDTSVSAKTGQGWDHWLALLDRAGARSMTHKEIVAVLRAETELSGWWQQTVAGTYERARGLRVRHEMPDGYQVSRSRSLAVALDRVFQAWADPVERESWLGPAPLAEGSRRDGKVIRFTCGDDDSRVEVSFAETATGKCRVVVRHLRIPDGDDAETWKARWAEALDRLQAHLEA